LGFVIFLNAAKIDFRVGTGISKPFGVVCFGSCFSPVTHVRLLRATG
jgi:hypothetical protein